MMTDWLWLYTFDRQVDIYRAMTPSFFRILSGNFYDMQYDPIHLGC